jgi:hypothetical protein
MTTITIATTSAPATITLTAASVARLTWRSDDETRTLWGIITVDGRNYTVAMLDYSQRNGAEMEAVNATINQILDAIDALQAPQHTITYCRETKDYTLLIDGQYCGSYRSHVEAETARDQIVSDRRADTHALDLARLAQDYQRARAEGRTEHARLIRQRALALSAHRAGISYEVFARELAAYQSEVRTAA